MAQSVIELKAKEISESITVTVHLKGLNFWEFRMQLALFLIRIGVWIAGTNYKEEV